MPSNQKVESRPTFSNLHLVLAKLFVRLRDEFLELADKTNEALPGSVEIVPKILFVVSPSRILVLL